MARDRLVLQEHVMKPFALVIYERYRDGSTIDELAREFQIPAERVRCRIRAAEAYLRRQSAPQ